MDRRPSDPWGVLCASARLCAREIDHEKNFAEPNPSIGRGVWLCRVLGEGTSRRAAVSRPMAACDTIDTSRHSLTALPGCRSAVIGHQIPPITKSATEPGVY